MKKNYYYAAIVVLILLCSASCSKVVEDLLTYNAPEVKTAFVVQIYDARTKELIGQNSNHEVRVIVKGKDKSLIKDLFGRSVSNIVTHKGIVSLSVSKNVTPSTGQPVEFVLQIESSGYITGSLPIVITSTGDHSFIARLVNLQMPPEGVTIFEGVIGSCGPDGIISENIFVATPPEPLNGAFTEINMTAGTLIKNATGELLSGQLTGRMVYYCNQYPDVLDCFPGSFCVKTLENGENGHNLFFSGGWADYEITDQTGKTAKTFNPPVQIKMDVPLKTYNPETKTLIQPGDYYPIWDYDFNKGIWVFENEGLLQGPASNGNLFINFSSTHFSKKNTDKKKCQQATPPEDCTRAKDWRKYLDMDQNLNIRSEKNNPLKKTTAKQKKNSAGTVTFTVPSNIRIILKEQSTDFVYWSSGYLNTYQDEESIYIPDLPCDLPTNVEIWGGCPYTLLGTTLVNDLCPDDPIIVPLSNPNPPSGNYTSVGFTVRVNCDFAHLRPNIQAFVDYGCGWKYIGMIENGQITVHGLEMGQGYSFGIWLEDQWFDEFFIVNQEQYVWDVDLPDDVCEGYRQ